MFHGVFWCVNANLKGMFGDRKRYESCRPGSALMHVSRWYVWKCVLASNNSTSVERFKRMARSTAENLYTMATMFYDTEAPTPSS